MNYLDKFGKVIAKELRDATLNRYLDIESGSSASEHSKAKSMQLTAFSEAQRCFIRELLTDCVDAGIHDFLFAVEEEREGLSIIINGCNVAELSDGLQGEIYTEDGWFEKFSQHKEKGI